MESLQVPARQMIGSGQRGHHVLRTAQLAVQRLHQGARRQEGGALGLRLVFLLHAGHQQADADGAGHQAAQHQPEQQRAYGKL